jgi:hypothetical protein
VSTALVVEDEYRCGGFRLTAHKTVIMPGVTCVSRTAVLNSVANAFREFGHGTGHACEVFDNRSNAWICGSNAMIIGSNGIVFESV